MPSDTKTEILVPESLADGASMGALAALGYSPKAITKEADACVSGWIPELIAHGHPQDQAIAIAYSKCERGEEPPESVRKDGPGMGDVHVAGPLGGEGKRRAPILKDCPCSLADCPSAVAKSSVQEKRVMVALHLPDAVAKALAVPGGESHEDLHITLAYLGKVGADRTLVQKAVDAVAGVCKEFAPLAGAIAGMGRFNASDTSDGKDVGYASYNAPGLPALRDAIVKALDDAGVPVSRKHGFTPHITLKYLEPNEEFDPRPSSGQFQIPHVSVTVEEERTNVPLLGTRTLKERKAQVLKAAKAQQIVYCIVLEPDTLDEDDELISAAEIEKSAHQYLVKSRVIGYRHGEVVNAELVESYVAPVDFEIEGQAVKKGCWIVGIHISDPELWAGVDSGKLNGVSVGGFSLKEEVA